MNWIDVLGWVATAWAISGAAAVSFKKVKAGLILYTIGNVCWIVWSLLEWQIQPLVTFSVFLALSTYGWWNHGR